LQLIDVFFSQLPQLACKRPSSFEKKNAVTNTIYIFNQANITPDAFLSPKNVNKVNRA
jgi:hypothetical protein